MGWASPLLRLRVYREGDTHMHLLRDMRVATHTLKPFNEPDVPMRDEMHRFGSKLKMISVCFKNWSTLNRADVVNN